MQFALLSSAVVVSCFLPAEAIQKLIFVVWESEIRRANATTNSLLFVPFVPRIELNIEIGSLL